MSSCRPDRGSTSSVWIRRLRPHLVKTYDRIPRIEHLDNLERIDVNVERMHDRARLAVVSESRALTIVHSSFVLRSMA